MDLDGCKVIGWKDYVGGKTAPYDDHGHGTHVASIAAGTGEGNAAYQGVAPGAALVGVKVLDRRGSGTWADVNAGIQWVIDNKGTYGIEVMNLSLGAASSSDGTSTTEKLVDAAVDAGIVAAVAAGTSGPRIVYPRRTSSRYLLSGLARCGHCGKALVGQDAKGGKFTYYVCDTLLKKGPRMCPAKYLPAPKFEGLVIDKVRESILTEDNLKELVRLVNEEMDAASGEYRGRLETVAAEIADVNQRLERLYDALETGKVTMDALSPRIQQLRERQKQLNAAKWELEALLADRHLELADEKTVRRFVEDLRALLGESPLTERRAFIRSFVKEIRVAGDQVVVTYTLPMPPKGLTEDWMTVPRIVQYGGRWGT